MQVSINKKDLLGMLIKSQNIVEKKNTMQALIYVLLEAKNNKLKLYATDLEISLIDEIDAEVQDEGQIAVQAKNFLDIVRELDDSKLIISQKNNNWVEIKQNRYSSKIVGFNPKEYPIFPAYSGDSYIKVKSNILKDMIDKTLYSVSMDETRYHLNGVFLERYTKSNELYLRMVATDGHRLSVIDKKIDNQFLQEIVTPIGVVIPRKGVNELRKILDFNSEDVYIAFEGPQIIIKSEKSLLMIRLTEGRYPNYQQFIPQKTNVCLSLNRNEFFSSLKRVSLFSNQKSKGILLNLSTNRMEISTANPELGDAKEEVVVNFSGPEMKIGFNASYIADILNAINDEKVDFELINQTSQGLIKPHSDSTYKCVVMPMRL